MEPTVRKRCSVADPIVIGDSRAWLPVARFAADRATVQSLKVELRLILRIYLTYVTQHKDTGNVGKHEPLGVASLISLNAVH